MLDRRSVEVALVLVGIGCLASAGFSYSRYRAFQQKALEQHSVANFSAHPPLDSSRMSDEPAVVGKLQIRRLGFQVAVVEGDDDRSLTFGAGHVPASAWGGQKGNMIVAGHRDSAFWPLRNVRRGDQIEVWTYSQSPNANRVTYRVERTYVVKPDNRRPLEDTRESMLTLITCYPFRHIGSAPDRFIVEARLGR